MKEKYVRMSKQKSFQSCPTLYDPMDYGPPGSFVHGNSPGKNTRMGHYALLQVSSQRGIEPASLMSPAFAGWFFATSATWEAPKDIYKQLVS